MYHWNPTQILSYYANNEACSISVVQQQCLLLNVLTFVTVQKSFHFIRENLKKTGAFRFSNVPGWNLTLL